MENTRPVTDAQETSPSQSPPALNDAIDRLLANPELISMVASAIGLGKEKGSAAIPSQSPSFSSDESPSSVSASEHKTQENSGADLATISETVAALSPLLSGLSQKSPPPPHHDDRRACLLRALKPYVSPGRAEAIDTILQVARISDLLRRVL